MCSGPPASSVLSRRVGFRNLNLRHELGGDDAQHLVQPLHVLRGKAVLNAVHDRVQVAVIDVVVVDIFLGHRQVVLPLVLGRALLADVAFLNEAVDLIGRVGGRDMHKPGEFVDGGPPQGQDNLHAEPLYRGEAGFLALKAGEHRLIKVQLKFFLFY